MSEQTMTTQCGYIALVGRPNVGKSTLLNHILATKLSITSRKPQTTQQQILGIKTHENIQAVYVDTPGLHQHVHKPLNRYMNRAASHALKDVDVVIWVIDFTRWTTDDDWVLEKLKKLDKPIIIALNKTDRNKDKAILLEALKNLAAKLPNAPIVPISAKHGTQIEKLEQLVARYLPEQNFFFPAEQYTDRNIRFLVAELIREKIIRVTGEELPYAVAIEIEQFEKIGAVQHISAVIWVEKAGQKKILIGTEGSQLKNIGQQARLDIQKLVHSKVFLRLWVKVKSGWSEDARALKSFGLG